MRRNYLEIARSGVDDILQRNGSDEVSKYRECQQVLCKTINEIMLDLQGKPFRDKAEEIGFYKEDAPHIWGLFMFYGELVKIEAARIYESPESFRVGLETRLKQVEAFFKERQCLCAYYYEGRTDDDESLFTRRGTHDGKDPLIDIRIDRDFTRGAESLSQMRKNELLRGWLTGQLKADSAVRSQVKLQFYGPQTELIELLKAMELNGNFGDVTFQHVIDQATEIFGIEINNHETALGNMSTRKTDTYCTRLRKKFDDFLDGKLPVKKRK